MFKSVYFHPPDLFSEAAFELARHPEVSLAVWRRTLQPELIQLLHAHALESGSDLLIETQPDYLAASIRQALVQGGVTRYPGWIHLQTDMTILGSLFIALTHAKNLQIELNIITGPHCTRFHADYNQSRLLCTYIGPGTLWTNFDNVIWCQDEQPPCVNGLHNPERVSQLDAFAIGFLKGRLHPDTQGYGQVHRSPDPPFGTPYRVMLKIDMI